MGYILKTFKYSFVFVFQKKKLQKVVNGNKTKLKRKKIEK